MKYIIPYKKIGTNNHVRPYKVDINFDLQANRFSRR